MIKSRDIEMRRARFFLCLLFLTHFVGAIVADGQVAATHGNPFLDADAADEGWPHVRGPNFDARSSELRLAESWPEDGPPVLWATELGHGYSSLVVKDNRAYTQYQSLAGQFVVCLDASDGRPIWHFRYDWPYQASGLYPGPRSTPTIANGRIYFSTPLGDVGCLSERGNLIWRQDLKHQFDGKGTGFGYSCSPTIVDGKVIMPVGGKDASMVALDALDGSVLWTSGSASSSYASALPILVDGHPQVIGYLEHELAAFDLESGRQLWSQTISHGYDEHSAWPIYSAPYLWTSAPFQAGSQLLRLTGGAESSFESVWQSPVMSNDVSSSVLVDGHLYGFDLAEAQSKAHRPSRGSFRSVNLLSGETSWENGNAKIRRSTDYDKNKQDKTIGHASVIVADGKLILLNDLGDLILAEANPKEYIELARTPAIKGDICWTPPALDRGRLFMRNHSRAVCIYIGEPALIDEVASGQLLSVNDLPQHGVVDFATILGVEPEYAMDPPTRRWLKIWFLTSMAILVAAGLLAAAAKLFHRSMSAQGVRCIFWAFAMGLGVLVGPPASIASGDFVFTWPVSLFVTFQIVVYQSTMRRKGQPRTRSKKWTDRTIAFAFLSICLGYFLLCRRLSLVTQWIFLCGFAAACPVLLCGRALARSQRHAHLLSELAITLVAFAAFFGSTCVLLNLRYELSDF
ncbi:MAG: PQQ-binding-like beta-propeller repeat protein [Planctomycetota bacterium]